MIKRILSYVAVLVLFALTLVGIKTGFDYFYNLKVINAVDKGDFSVSEAPIRMLNVFEPYIALYNDANILYKKGDYDAAIETYKEALAANVPEGKECAIRVNLALSMIETLPEYDSEKNIKNAISILEDARDVLVEQDCASKKGEGHDKNAQKLKKSIDKEIDHLKDLLEQDAGGSGDGNDDGDDKQPDDGKEVDSPKDMSEKDIEEQLLQIQNDSMGERIDSMRTLEVLDSDMNWDFGGKIW